jgi:hypothetical protein
MPRRIGYCGVAGTDRRNFSNPLPSPLNRGLTVGQEHLLTPNGGGYFLILLTDPAPLCRKTGGFCHVEEHWSRQMRFIY